jgi:hypothetical protein
MKCMIVAKDDRGNETRKCLLSQDVYLDLPFLGPARGRLEMVLGTANIVLLATGEVDVKIDGRQIQSLAHRGVAKIQKGEVRDLCIGEVILTIAGVDAN